MLEALAEEPRRWSTLELAQLGMTPHSRKSDLVKLGYEILITRVRGVGGEKPVYFYELVGVPAVAPAFEEFLSDRARARLRLLRASGSLGDRTPGGDGETGCAPVSPAGGVDPHLFEDELVGVADLESDVLFDRELVESAEQTTIDGLGGSLSPALLHEAGLA